VGDVCTLLSCLQAPIETPCVLPDGGAGFCGGGVCQGGGLWTPYNCGAFGFQCPVGDSCVFEVGCVSDAGVAGCGPGSPPCPAGTSCSTEGICVWSSCTASLNDQSCGVDEVCCGTDCVTPNDAQNCGACGLSCGSNAICLDSCTPVAPCSSAGDNAPCSLPDSTGFCCHGACQDPATDSQDCRACGQSCTSCTPDAGCPQGKGCTIDGLCAPLSCSGLGDGTACSVPSVLGLYEPGRSGNQLSQYGSETLLTECCSGSCVDLDFDSSNCGACGTVCPSGTACQGGTCFQSINCALAINGSPCWLGAATGEGLCCGGACVDTASDPNNCGLCGASCPAGDPCVGPNSCAAEAGTVAAETTCGSQSDGDQCDLDGGVIGVCCGGSCAEPTAIENCALCGLGCLHCAGGCPSGTTCTLQGSEDEGNRIVPIESCLPTACSPGKNGGECAFGPSAPGPTSYPGPGYLAESGIGPLELGNAGYCCGGACVDIGQDPDNCGLCGVSCPSGICGLGDHQVAECLPGAPSDDCAPSCALGTICIQGQCVSSFCTDPVSPFQDCAASDGNIGLCCSNSGLTQAGLLKCSDLANDPDNCGGCGFACPMGLNCSHGVCSGTPTNCGVGRIGGFCDFDAGPTFVCCPGVGCTNLATDEANCGNCGVECSAGMGCSLGECQ
jgi:hypothetical protein